MVTVEVINRVFFIKVEQYGTGTVVDHNGKQYLVTAKHLLEGKEEVSSIKFYHDEQWKDLNVQLVGIGRGELDIAVFSSDLLLCRKDLPLPNGTKGIGLSQDVYMLGFPYKMHTKAGETLGGRPCPFVKKGILASLFDDGFGVPKLYIDAMNNEGFSGGPIVFRDTTSRKMQLAGIVSKYRTESESVMCDEGEDTGWSITYNTGITIGYDISEAIKIIEANPIGFEL
ncbi:trypsin-like peptidase domain-containing protein [Vibrio parahaemolyticus]|uniref:S1 family peptidase n=1 Tax=Vibrio parahaemolyticus TaxID=670 RepID=UPI001301FA07|nr:serine protease [Vibrio parahaemolyticus]EIQ1514524.1 trypsin-like peptidase domain-containing protein [Vibrio parahaemolyticus]EJT1887680.1 trypsin-like peptidase domain-containing protein [Vibrio parahaemolyticus]ELB2775404.1 trypsin-like peptidase domain-containing protein [Vibrio parahaemolyticus]